MEKVADSFRHLREGELSHFSLKGRIVIYPFRVLVRAFEEFFADQCLQRASALAFASLLALVPVTAIFFSFITKLEAFSQLRGRVEDFLFRNLVPTRTDVIRQYLVQYTENVTLLGIFGIMALFIAAIFLFNTIEHTINIIWHAKQRRPFRSKFTSFWTVLTASPLLVFASFYIAAKFTAKGNEAFSLRLLTYSLNGLAFYLAYQFVPYTHVRVRAAVVGAVAGATLWELAKGGFNWYITSMTQFDRIYGSLGAVPVFLLWVYLTWVIVLFGSEVAYAVQYPKSESRLSQAQLADYLDFFSVRTMAEIVRRFNDGDTAAGTIDRLKEIGIPSEILGEILNRLTDERLVFFTEEKDYVPARHPSKMTVREVIEAVSGKKLLAPDTVKDPVSRKLRESFQQITRDMDSSLDDLNMQMLVDNEPE